MNGSNLTCEWTRGTASDDWDTRCGNINRNVTPDIPLLPSNASFGTNCKFDEDIECSDCRLDVEMKPGGASTPSSISIARCNRACLSQSSIWYSSDENLGGFEQKWIWVYVCLQRLAIICQSSSRILYTYRDSSSNDGRWSMVTTSTFAPPALNRVDWSNSSVADCCDGWELPLHIDVLVSLDSDSLGT